ncbi:hypothetical protein Aspvir_009270 [Aspergillus viridinutans]|uniref:7alpha-cephem-methoxylase P8 chain n=1 Tax=Aspergillus viridinutans TaxID=75553 RepID=A0A9P3C058_ASPVI|nr:uncharacterized protein Aspvir_009270 [Aspergillus viridinutans]GIK05167.1 hypothetical protein Aspvir_009270 [Aspergillus viridinutans]
MAPALPTAHTFAKFNYLKWQDIYRTTRPFSNALALSSSDKQQGHNLVFERGEAQRVTDARGIESSFDLDRNGFIYRTHKPPLTPEEFTDAEKVEKVYLADCEKVLRDEVDDVTEVLMFDWRVRRSDSTGPVKLEGAKAGGLQLPAADFVHNDQTEVSAIRRTRASFPPEYAERLLAGRVQMLNLWRPINSPVENHPLAVCDGSSYDPSKLLEADIIREKYTGHMMYALYDPGMAWYYKSRQRDDEIVIFKSYDSKDGVAKYVPHSAFALPDKEPGDYVRMSIEVRAMVFSDTAS